MPAQSTSKKITWVADGIGYRILADGKTRAYCIDYFDAAGKRVRAFKDPEHGAKMTKERDAVAALAFVTVRKVTGAQIVKSKVKLDAFSVEWLDRQATARPGTLAGWTSNLNLHVLPALGQYEVARIGEHQIRDLILAKRKAGLAEATIANIVQPLRMILGEAVTQRILATNPWERVPKKERPKPSQTQKRRRVLTLDEVDRLLAGAAASEGDAVRLFAFVSLLVFMGLRKSEALGLVWEDVDFEAGEIHVRRQLAVNGIDRVELKTAASRRTVSISRELRAALLAWKMKSGHSTSEAFVFCTQTGTAITQRNAYRMVVGLAEAMGINEVAPEGASEDWQPKLPPMDLHSLRHVFISAMVLATKGDAEAVASMSGHSDTEMIVKTYSHEFSAVRGGTTVAERAALIDKAFGG